MMWISIIRSKNGGQGITDFCGPQLPTLDDAEQAFQAVKLAKDAFDERLAAYDATENLAGRVTGG